MQFHLGSQARIRLLQLRRAVADPVFQFAVEDQEFTLRQPTSGGIRGADLNQVEQEKHIADELSEMRGHGDRIVRRA